jgi:hypothetical protein
VVLQVHLERLLQILLLLIEAVAVAAAVVVLIIRAFKVELVVLV